MICHTMGGLPGPTQLIFLVKYINNGIQTQWIAELMWGIENIQLSSFIGLGVHYSLQNIWESLQSLCFIYKKNERKERLDILNL